MHPLSRTIRGQLRAACTALALSALLLTSACVGGVPNTAAQRAEYDRAMYYQKQSEDPEVGHSKEALLREPTTTWSTHANAPPLTRLDG